MRTPQLQRAGSWCLCRHCVQTLLLRHHQGARRRPSRAQHAQTSRGNHQMPIYLKVNPFPPCKTLFSIHPKDQKQKCFPPPCPATESKFQSVKRALHTAVPERLLSREAERESIRSFLEETVLQRHPGSLYISGAPGTGKSACLNCVLQEMKVAPTHKCTSRAPCLCSFPCILAGSINQMSTL